MNDTITTPDIHEITNELGYKYLCQSTDEMYSYTRFKKDKIELVFLECQTDDISLSVTISFYSGKVRPVHIELTQDKLNTIYLIKCIELAMIEYCKDIDTTLDEYFHGDLSSVVNKQAVNSKYNDLTMEPR